MKILLMVVFVSLMTCNLSAASERRQLHGVDAAPSGVATPECLVCFDSVDEATLHKCLWCSAVCHVECYDSSARENQNLRGVCIVCKLPLDGVAGLSKDDAKILGDILRLPAAADENAFVDQKIRALADFAGIPGKNLFWWLARFNKLSTVKILLQRGFELKPGIAHGLIGSKDIAKDLRVLFGILCDHLKDTNPSASDRAVKARALRSILQSQPSGAAQPMFLAKLITKVSPSDVARVAAFVREVEQANFPSASRRCIETASPLFSESLFHAEEGCQSAIEALRAKPEMFIYIIKFLTCKTLHNMLDIRFSDGQQFGPELLTQAGLAFEIVSRLIDNRCCDNADVFLAPAPSQPAPRMNLFDRGLAFFRHLFA